MSWTLHVIGNGFDIANGVRSSYRDFREYLMGQGPDGVRLVNSLESCLGGAPDLWGDFEESLASMDRGRAMDSVDAAMGRSRRVRWRTTGSGTRWTRAWPTCWT